MHYNSGHSLCGPHEHGPDLGFSSRTLSIRTKTVSDSQTKFQMCFRFTILSDLISQNFKFVNLKFKICFRFTINQISQNFKFVSLQICVFHNLLVILFSKFKFCKRFERR